MSVPSVSVIISVFGQLQHTKRCLTQLEETLVGVIDYEVLIIDDASKDGTVEFLKGLGERYRVFFNDQNQGFAKNNNLGAREARGEYLCFLNNDVFVQGDWLTPMLRVFDEKKTVGMVGNVQKLANSRRYDHMGIVFAPQGNPRHFGQGFLHRPFKGKVRKWSAVTAACCVAKRECFWEIEGFDEVFVNGCEDIDLCLRMSEAGLEHHVVHDSVVEHVKGASEGRKIFNDKNSDLLQERWGSRIRENQSVGDQFLHARTYLYHGLTRPWATNFSKWTEALTIFLGFRKLKSP
ncbi:MAG: glycosyltransferase family 2 protein [Opitutae bacterium]|jgi:O-antigen biosynthesis protein|nr:glycosyltransferase family 2 protein [Opitutae bacterium]